MIKKLKSKRSFLYMFSLALLAMFAVSCEDDDDGDGKDMLKERTVELDTKQEIPSVMDRMEKGTANFKVYDDSTLTFTINVTSLDASDPLTVAHIHVGSPVDVGAPLIPLVDNSTIKFQGGAASGNIKLNATQFNSIKDELTQELYVNVHSTKFPNGLIRGQMDQTITFAQNVALTPISSPLRPETGQAILRMAKDSTLIYKVTVNNLTPGDALTGAHINVGATGVTGPSVIHLYTAATEFDTKKTMKLNASQATFLLTDEVYISVNSTQVPAELLRGQIR